MIKLYLMDASREGQSFDFEGDSICIGRSTENEIRVRDRFVSRVHLKIFRKGEAYFIEDLKSKNGTVLNGNRIDSGTAIQVEEGVPIAIGMSVLCLGKGCLEGIMTFLDMVFSAEDSSSRMAWQVPPKIENPSINWPVF
ncbi:MAG: FHA domain-containing protein [Deltaproteobacteria bacterium]|nr:FHA domain-containing protein [Deltaproteobacteria bacterium]